MHRNAVGFRNGIKNWNILIDYYISLLCLSCLHTAHPHVAAHIESTSGTRGNTLKIINVVFLKRLSQSICWFITHSAATNSSLIYHMIRKNSVKLSTALSLTKIQKTVFK